MKEISFAHLKMRQVFYIENSTCAKISQDSYLILEGPDQGFVGTPHYPGNYMVKVQPDVDLFHYKQIETMGGTVYV